MWSQSVSSAAQSCPTLWVGMECSMPGLPVYHQLPEPTGLMSVESMMPSNHLILCLSLLLPLIFPSISVFSNESVVHIKWPKCWSFSFTISPSGVYSGLTSFTINLFNLLAVQGTLKSFLQHQVRKHYFFWHSAIFMVQLTSARLLERP